MEKIFKENSELRIVKAQSGRENRIVPLSMELEVKNGSDLYDNIFNFSRFQKFKEYELTKKYEGAEDSEYLRKKLEQLKQDCEGANIKITIKIELEKYE